jgi:2-methylisocitrate lyase-like PEP mutase family enzyme
MVSQLAKGKAFRDLHARRDAFIIPNPFDIGSAQLLAGIGFEALATTSAGHAFSLGRRDYAVNRDETIAHVAAIAGATNLPVSADLENGFGDSPEEVARTLRAAARAGAVGGSIEDATGRTEAPLYDHGLAVDRIRAAVEVVKSLPFPFILTARAENFLVGQPDLNAVIQRLQADQEAGADVLYAPALTKAKDIATIVRSVDRPVNVVMGLQGVQLSRSELSVLGVKRISVGSALGRAAYGALLRAAQEMHDFGTFSFAGDVVAYRALNEMFPVSLSGDFEI